MLELIPVVETRDLGWIDPKTNVAGLYQLNRLSKAELQAAIDFLLELPEGIEETIEDSCPLFGGVIVVVDGRPRLRPQCCGDLSDINDWFRMAEDTFSESYICNEGHPAPYASRHGDALIITCREEGEEFSPGTDPEFVVQRSELLKALPSLRAELEQFCRTVDELSDRYGVARLSRILVAVEPVVPG
ncbi:MAG TPA: hypothetical protein VJ725_30110 [Thermoanaerobaculia bacterium]|nr:hypothetical protein [Thermoanaerobaculia bacterium]